MKNTFLMLIFLTVLFGSCKKNLPEVGATSAQSMANEWWITLKLGGQDVFNLGHKKLATYNTSANTNDMWIDDLKNTYGFKVKVNSNFSALTFSATNSSDEYYDVNNPANFPLTVSISNGKVFVGQGRSKTGNVTDSIYMQAVFSDDPGDTFIISGHARTKFKEDEY